jgi:hypothetical protein
VAAHLRQRGGLSVSFLHKWSYRVWLARTPI